MKHITVIDGHPDVMESHLNHALADRYAEAARAAGNEVRRIDVARLEFPLLRDPEEFYNGEPPAEIRNAQRDIQWADHVALFYPLWNGDVPALLKGFIEQTFRPGFSMEYQGAMRFPKKLLKGRSARIVVTMGMPAFIYRAVFGEHTLKSLKQSILGMCGFNPVQETLFGSVEGTSDGRRMRWLDQIATLAERDGAGEKPVAVGRILAIVTLLGAAAYLARSSA